MKMIIDTDPGIDDALAISLAHAMPQVELAALTTVFGNTHVGQSARNGRYLAHLLGADFPVAKGAALPIGATNYAPSDYVHGPEGFGDMNPVPQIGQDAAETAADLLVRMARENAGQLAIVAIGPLTNIAAAIDLDPDFVGNVAQLVIMGGALDVPGNVTPHAEANIFHDPKAADAVFAAGFNMTMVGLNATHQTLLTPQDFMQMAVAAPQVGGFVKRISDFYLRFYRSIGITNGCPIHDATAVLACTQPDRFSFRSTGIRVPLSGDFAGATVADATRPPVQVAMGVDAGWATATVLSQIATLP